MNKGFYEDLDTNFAMACKLSELNFSHDKLIELLKTGNIPEKQIAAMQLDTILNENEAQILIDNLTGCDGKIREAVALKINQLLHQDKEVAKLFIFPEIFADATIDINGNICRLVIDSVEVLSSNETFSKKYIEKILQFIKESFTELDNFIFRDKKYVINKQLFKLYWALEALKVFVNNIDKNILKTILERASLEKEYTIREKVAQILMLINSDDFLDLKSKLTNDENYYVRQALS